MTTSVYECHYCGGSHPFQHCPRIANFSYYENGNLAQVHKRDLRELAYMDWLESLSPEQRTAHLFSQFDPNFSIDAAVVASWMGRVVGGDLPRGAAWKFLKAVVNRDPLFLDACNLLRAPSDWASETLDLLARGLWNSFSDLGIPEAQQEKVRDELLSWCEGGDDSDSSPGDSQ